MHLITPVHTRRRFVIFIRWWGVSSRGASNRFDLVVVLLFLAENTTGEPMLSGGRVLLSKTVLSTILGRRFSQQVLAC